MTHLSLQKLLLLFGLILFIIILIVYYIYPRQIGYTPMSEIKQNPYTQNLTSRCVGRFSIDLPNDFQAGLLSNGTNVSEMNRHQIITQPMTEKEFNTQLWMREDELKDDTKHVFVKPEDKPYLKDAYPLKDGRKGVIFNHNEGIGNKDALRELEGHLFSNNVGIILKIQAIDVDNPRYAYDKRVFKFVTDLPQKRSEIQDLLSRMEGWDNIHTPQGKGTCYQNVFIKGAAGDYEYAANLYYYKGDRALRIIIEYDTDLHSTDTMLERSSEIKHYASEAPEGKILRFAKRDTDYIHAEEFLASGKNVTTGKTEYTFILRMNEMNGIPQTPAITITLQNDGLISEKDALAIWDTIIPTLKPRAEAY